MKPAALAKRLRVEHPKHFRLKHCDPADTCGLEIDKEEANDILTRDIGALQELQERLYAENRWALLVILQGMDAAGKDSTIKHVLSGVNPQGCDVHAFRAPSAEDLDHDYLWRSNVRLPARGRIGIFNRSYYEEVLAVRVHANLLAAQHLPGDLVGKHIWRERCEDIVAFERYLARNGIAVLKLHLRISQDEQRRRLLARLDEPAKRWKFSLNDVAERKLWPRYMQAYEDMIRHTSSAHAPWYVIPADHKPFAHLAVAATMVHTLDRLGLEYPKVGRKQLHEMQAVRRALEKNG
jgi:PPK2 family polyphosphate:nucleotide phosphotransferase